MPRPLPLLWRFTKDGANAFAVDFGDGKVVQDTRPLKGREQNNQPIENSAVFHTQPQIVQKTKDGARDQVPGRMDEHTGKIDVLGKDGKFHSAGSIPHNQEASVEEFEQDRKSN